MIVIDVDPILARWGPFSLSWHGLFLAAGLVVGYAALVRQGTRRGIPRPALAELAVWLLVAGLAGARLLHVLGDLPGYLARPASVLAVTEGGLTITGGLLGGLAAAAVLARRRGIDFWTLADALALAAPLALFVGRTGCTILGDAAGVPADGWGLVYRHPGVALPPELLGVPTFPAPLVLQAGSLVLWAVLLALRGRAPFPGFLVGVFLVLYGAGRIAVNVWQPGEPVWLGLKYLQLVGAAFILLGGTSLVALKLRAGRSARAPAGERRLGGETV